jgi:hypothetical protein
MLAFLVSSAQSFANSFSDCFLYSEEGVPRGPAMKSETKRRLRAMSDTEREKRLDELNRKLGITQPKKLVEPDPEEIEEREWLKKKLGYEHH